MGRPKATHCIHGHEYTPKNTRIRIKDGKEYKTCRTCGRAAWKKHYETNDGYRKRNKTRSIFLCKERKLVKLYGITSIQKHQMLMELQDGKCATCGSDKPQGAGGRGHGQWHTDHCHKTGQVRGILCARCNLVLTQKMNVRTLIKMASYLLKYPGGF